MQETINYNWDKNSNETDSSPEVIEDAKVNLATRKNLHLMRRLFHVINGSTFATIYLLSFSHEQMVHLLGTIASLLYLFEQVRINYPEHAKRFLPMTRFVMRAEEQLKESAMVPYIIAVLLSIITFPKPIALIAIYTLAIADPLSAIVGIKYGKRRIVPHKSLEGSLAFFIATFLCSVLILPLFIGGFSFTVFAISTLIAFIAASLEMLPLKLDDNLTIPLFTGASLWLLCLAFGLRL